MNQINSILLKSDQLTMPSYFTIEYINIALHKIEGSLLLLKGRNRNDDVLVDIFFTSIINHKSLLIHQKYNTSKYNSIVCKTRTAN